MNEALKHIEIVKELGLCIAAPEPCVSEAAGGDHVFSAHTPLWAFMAPSVRSPFAPWLEARPLFDELPAGATVADALEKTRLLCILGAHESPVMDAALAADDVMRLIFEPDPNRLEAFLTRRSMRPFLDKTTYFISGDIRTLSPSLSSILPAGVTQRGFPVFYTAQPVTHHAVYAEAVRQMELHYYRHAIYPVAGPDNFHGFPLRAMNRETTYDRETHAYENLTVCPDSGSLGDLKEAFAGESAILIAAGPTLPDLLDWIRSQRERAVLIAVNNALPTLVEHDAPPDFVVINDTSIVAGACFDKVGRLEKTTLVGHCLARLPRKKFGKVFVFGNHKDQPFPKREGLLLHGSVITTAFSLAEYMGCARAYLAGAQLASPNPFRLSYARGTVHGEHHHEHGAAALPGRYPQLYPVKAADGSRVYTTLNFYDAAEWFLDRIRTSSVEVVNTTPGSIIFGDGVVQVDPAPTIPASTNLAACKRAVTMRPPPEGRQRAMAFAKQEMLRWRETRKTTKAVLAQVEQHGQAALPVAAQHIAACDQNGVSFMLTQFPGAPESSGGARFENATFHDLFFQDNDPAARVQGAQYFLTRLAAMSNELVLLLKDQLERLHSETTAPDATGVAIGNKTAP